MTETVSTETFEATIGKTFMEWLEEHYETPSVTDPPTEPAYFICRRCGKQVGWVTRHAVERHGDNFPIVAPTERMANSMIAEMW